MSKLVSLQTQILYQDEYMVGLYKPHGVHTVPHENPIHRVKPDQVLLYQAKKLTGKYLYPVHRLDAGTSGVVIFAFTSEAARDLQQLFQSQNVSKTYEAVVRGFVPESGHIDTPLELDSTHELVEAKTEFVRLKTVEFQAVVGHRNPTARYSLVEVYPLTGRYHQIRRHFARKSHPVLGDAAHGDSKHNQFFRNELKVQGLCLRSKQIKLIPPWNLRDEISIQSPTCEKWEKIYRIFDFCS